MSAKFYEDTTDGIVPWTATYTYPSQASKTWKYVTKLPPVNGNSFSNTANQAIQINFPAQSYLNCKNSFLQFDLTMTVPASGWANVRFQNNIQSIFSRARLLYGSYVIEDLQDYNILVRAITEATNSNQNNGINQESINDGIAGLDIVGFSEVGITTGPLATATAIGTGYVNGRLGAIQGSNFSASALHVTGGAPLIPDGTEGTTSCTRRYCVQLYLGAFLQEKLIPLKWMASQLQLWLELAPSKSCMCATKWTTGTEPSYTLTNVNYLAEFYDFDAAYDEGFLQGLKKGVPIKFGSWDRFIHPANTAKVTNFYPERNRSIKAAICVQIANKVGYGHAASGAELGQATDSHAFVQSSTGITATSFKSTAGSMLNSYQWRVGQKYYPSQPVTCNLDTTKTNGAGEAYLELAKALKIVGDYKFNGGITSKRWCPTSGAATQLVVSSVADWAGVDCQLATDQDVTLAGPSYFVIAADFETSDGAEISGINGEEQNDIALNIDYNDVQDGTFYTFIYFDELLILGENNRVQVVK